MSELTPSRRKLKNINLMKDPAFNSKLVITEFRRKFARWLERGHPKEPYKVYEIRSKDFKPSARAGHDIDPTGIFPHDPHVKPCGHYWVDHAGDEAHYALFFDSFHLDEHPHGANLVDETRLVLFRQKHDLDSIIKYQSGLPQIDDAHIETEMKVENYWYDNNTTPRIHQLKDIILWTNNALIETKKRPNLLEHFFQYLMNHTDATAEQASYATSIIKRVRPPSDVPQVNPLTPPPAKASSAPKYASWPIPGHVHPKP